MTDLVSPTLPQVQTEHYRPAHYDQFHRWVSYWYQIQSILRSRAKTVLEIGVGSGVVSSYLRSRLNVAVTTCDLDETLGADLIGDVRHLDQVVSSDSFDAVVAFQVLEHLPFADLPDALAQMRRASSNAVIISLPYYGWAFQFRIGFRKWNWVLGRKISKYPRWNFDGQHYWEIGTRGHSLSHVRRTICSVLNIRSEYFCADHPYHYFFECGKRLAS